MADPTASRPSICFVALNAYGLLAGESSARHIGGAEVQQVLIARGLLERGYPVSFITLDHGQEEGLTVDGIRTFKAFRSEAGLPGLRFLHPRITGLWGAMARSHADTYYQRTSESDTGIVAAFARRHGRRFIFAVGALEDCLTNLPHCRTRRERVLYRYGLRRADRVIAQTQQQQALLRESFGVESTLVRSCGGDPTRSTGILPVTHGLEGRATGDRGDAPPVHRVLWIGRFTAQKRLEMLFDVAERCPNVQFDVVGEGDTDDPYVRELQARGTGLANVALHGRVPHNQVSTFYRRAGLLLCTSSAEGFPNTFLEAWSQGIPVVSTFDPDGLIVDRALGAVAAQGPELASAIRGLLDARERLHELGGNCRRYYLQNHALEAVLPRLESIILDLQSSIGP